MTDKLKQSEKAQGEKYEASKEKKGGKSIKITNRFNFPCELKFGKVFFKRLEPRGKEGDSVVLDSKYLKHNDFESQKRKIVIEEV